jgi:hypothetical protein
MEDPFGGIPDFLRGDPAHKTDERALAVIGISERKPDLAKWHEPGDDLRRVSVAWLRRTSWPSAPSTRSPASSPAISLGNGCTLPESNTRCRATQSILAGEAVLIVEG